MKELYQIAVLYEADGDDKLAMILAASHTDDENIISAQAITALELNIKDVRAVLVEKFNDQIYKAAGLIALAKGLI